MGGSHDDVRRGVEIDIADLKGVEIPVRRFTYHNVLGPGSCGRVGRGLKPLQVTGLILGDSDQDIRVAIIVEVCNL